MEETWERERERYNILTEGVLNTDRKYHPSKFLGRCWREIFKGYIPMITPEEEG